MNYTTNFNLNKPEGTDLYNHLTIDNPNMDIIDGAMQANKLASVGNATELVSGTVHAITRSDSSQNIFKFKATGDFKAGDTITVDGVSVNAYTTDGQLLTNDAYVLSAQVLCILDGTSLWVFVNKEVLDAEDVNYDNTASGLTATDVQDAIDEVNEKIETVTAENLTTNIDIMRCGKIRTVRLNFFAPTNTIFYTLSSTDRPKKDITTIARWQATNNKYYSALVTIQTNGNISASYFTESTAAFISDGTIIGALTYLTA